jgi:RNA polymerase sigma-70 factor (ECF subfamily)
MSHRTTSRCPEYQFQATLDSAQHGSRDSLGALLESCRQYLLLIANQELNPALTAKLGASDLVQETFATAGRHIHQFRGTTERELLAWLRQVLLSHLVAAKRRYLDAQKRSVYRELSLHGYFYPLADALPADTSTPSCHVMHEELTQLFESALARLPDHYREIITLRHRERLPFDKIARQLDITPDTARQRWLRAIQHLQKELGAAEII